MQNNIQEQMKREFAEALLGAFSWLDKENRRWILFGRYTVELDESGSVALCKRDGKLVGRIYREKFGAFELDEKKFLNLAMLVFEGVIQKGGYTMKELIRLDEEQGFGIFDGILRVEEA